MTCKSGEWIGDGYLAVDGLRVVPSRKVRLAWTASFCVYGSVGRGMFHDVDVCGDDAACNKVECTRCTVRRSVWLVRRRGRIRWLDDQSDDDDGDRDYWSQIGDLAWYDWLITSLMIVAILYLTLYEYCKHWPISHFTDISTVERHMSQSRHHVLSKSRIARNYKHR